MKNNAARSRRFDYKSCVLDWGPAHAIAARFIAWSLMLGSPGFDWQTEFDASEEKEQWLGFAYPVEYLPTLVACGDNVVKLSYQAGSRAP